MAKENKIDFIINILGNAKKDLETIRNEVVSTNTAFVFKSYISLYVKNSNKLPNGNFLPSLDISINDKIMDIRFVTKSEVKTIVNILTAKAKQLKNVFTKTGIYSESVCLFFYDSSIYNDRLINLAIEEYRKNHRRIKEIYCVINNESGELKIYNI